MRTAEAGEDLAERFKQAAHACDRHIFWRNERPSEGFARLATAARERGVPLHFDGACLWEAQVTLDRPLAEIAGLADSVYVSFYKGLGAMAGAAVAGDEDLVAELRVWRHRMGGTLYRLTPYALGALVGLRQELLRMPEYVAWARSLASALAERGLRTRPEVPAVPTFELYADGSADELNERSIAEMKRVGVALPIWRTTADPGSAVTTLVTYAAASEWPPEKVVDLIETVLRP